MSGLREQNETWKLAVGTSALQCNNCLETQVDLLLLFYYWLSQHSFFLHVLCSFPYIYIKGQIEESKEILLLRLTHLLFFGWMMRVCNANVQMAVSPIVVEVLHFKCTIYFPCCEKSAPRVHGSNVFCLYSPLCWAFFFHPKELCHPCSSLVR